MYDDHQNDDNELVEITVDVGENGLSLRHVIPAASPSARPSALSQQEASIVVDYVEMGSGRLLHGSSSKWSTSQRLKQLSVDLRRLSRNGSRLLSGRFNSDRLMVKDDLDDVPVSDDLEPAFDLSLPAHVRRPSPHRTPSKFYPHADGIQLDRTVSRSTEHALEGLKIINEVTDTADQKEEWERVKARFHTLKNEEGLLNKNHFAECINMGNSKEFAGELFNALTRKAGKKLDHAKMITEDDLYLYWVQISNQSFDARIQIFFELCDKNGDGKISGQEIVEVLKLSASANKLQKLQDQAEEYAALIMEELDTERQGFIELWQLEALLRGPSGGFNREQYSNQILGEFRKKNSFQHVGRGVRHSFYDNRKRIWIILLWFGVMAGLFTWKVLQYEKHAAFHIMHYCLPVAKGAAETLKLNMAIILLPMCRNTLTYLRSTFLHHIVPFDDSINFHILIATAIALAIVTHGGVHLVCDFSRVVTASHSNFERYVGVDFNYEQPKYEWFLSSVDGITGIVMVILMVIAFTFATKWFRKSLIKLPRPFHTLTGFNMFWYSHHLFIIVYALLIVHSECLLFVRGFWNKTTWMYLTIPFLLYFGERVLRFTRAGRYQVEVVKAAIYPGNVVSLHFVKPKRFVYKSGMYIFVNCPEISPIEWHPFSITSAPGDAYLSIHIRTLGDWTRKLCTLFESASGDRKRLQTQNSWDLSGEVVPDVQFPKIKMDGPYGAPAQDYRNYDVLLLIGLGIGATPFISILKDILNGIKEESVSVDCSTSDVNYSSLHSGVTPSRRKSKQGAATKAYFYWVTKEQGSFDWFRGIVREIEENDKQLLIEMHNYLTSVYEEGDTRSALIMMLQALHHAKNGMDFVSGTRARTHFGRPNWKQVFSKLAATHKGKQVGVFYCGPSGLAQELNNLSKSCNRKLTTRFEFHQENF